jgi:hypothetical protein
VPVQDRVLAQALVQVQGLVPVLVLVPVQGSG